MNVCYTKCISNGAAAEKMLPTIGVTLWSLLPEKLKSLPVIWQCYYNVVIGFGGSQKTNSIST